MPRVEWEPLASKLSEECRVWIFERVGLGVFDLDEIRLSFTWSRNAKVQHLGASSVGGASVVSLYRLVVVRRSLHLWRSQDITPICSVETTQEVGNRGHNAATVSKWFSSWIPDKNCEILMVL